MRLLDSLIQSNVFVALVLSTLAASTYFILPGLTFQWHLVISVFLGSFVLYNFHRLYKIDSIPIAELLHRHTWTLEYADLIKVAMGLATIGGLYMLTYYTSNVVAWLIPPGILSLAYTVPLIPNAKNWLRLRDIPLTKPILITLVVTYLTLCFPVFEQKGIEGILKVEMAYLFIERFFFLMVVTLPFEIRDIDHDRKAGLTTIATQFGVRKTQYIGLLTAMLWALILISGTDFSVSLGNFVFGISMLMLVLFAYSKLDQNRGEYFYVICFEGLILVYAIGSMLPEQIQP